MRESQTDFNDTFYHSNTEDPLPDTQADYNPSAFSDFNLSDLLKGVYAKLYPLFAIDCAVLVCYNQKMTQITNLYRSEMLSGAVSCTAIKGDFTQLSAITNEISAFEFPILRSKKEWIATFGENHQIGNQQADYQFHGYIPIESGGKIYGTLELHNFDRELNAEGLKFCCNVADFIAGLFEVNAERGAKNNLPFLPKLNGEVKQQAVHQEETIVQLEDEIRKLKTSLDEFTLFTKEELTEMPPHNAIVGTSVQMQEVFRLLNRISPTETTVLILGETGTGKELIAKSVHDHSPRAAQKLIKVNCAAIPINLMESELFGHEKGSFTGATEKRIGKFELAHQGTIFLDEIGEMPLDLQVKLLRVLQEKEIERIGGKTTIRTDVRIISATNRNLLSEVEAGRFRQDLFYRLNVFPITIPPLRTRRSDIPLLALHFLEKFAAKLNRHLEGFSKKAMGALVNYSWPGNVRELEHLIERHLVINQGKMINSIEIPDQSNFNLQDANKPVKTIFENERDHIFSVLELCNGRISGKNGAAKLLGVPATTLNSKIKRLGLAKKHII